MRIAGLDLSLQGLGAVVVDAKWDLRFDTVERASFGVPLRKDATTREVTDRLRALCLDVRVWLIRMGATHVVAEDLPPHAKGFSMVPLAELRGALRLELLREANLDLQFVNQSRARKILLGKLPPKDRKKHVVEALKAAGAGFDDADQADAFCTVNAVLDGFEIPHLHNLLWASEPKPNRRRAAPRFVSATGSTVW
jgi:Holliday junction resolvasome RuvABC endonuclease subunit